MLKRRRHRSWRKLAKVSIKLFTVTTLLWTFNLTLVNWDKQWRISSIFKYQKRRRRSFLRPLTTSRKIRDNWSVWWSRSMINSKRESWLLKISLMIKRLLKRLLWLRMSTLPSRLKLPKLNSRKSKRNKMRKRLVFQMMSLKRQPLRASPNQMVLLSPLLPLPLLLAPPPPLQSLCHNKQK